MLLVGCYLADTDVVSRSDPALSARNDQLDSATDDLGCQNWLTIEPQSAARVEADIHVIGRRAVQVCRGNLHKSVVFPLGNVVLGSIDVVWIVP